MPSDQTRIQHWYGRLRWPAAVLLCIHGMILLYNTFKGEIVIRLTGWAEPLYMFAIVGAGIVVFLPVLTGNRRADNAE